MLETGTRLGRYTIGRQLGAGGKGEVYHASGDDGDVAIKILPARLAQDRMARARFQREIGALMALEHENILKIFEYGNDVGVHFAVMELLEGETLKARVRRAPIPWTETVPLARGLARALVATHTAGIIHRDIKPDNIFLTAGGGLKLLDFGLVRIDPDLFELNDEALLQTGPGIQPGTVPYMSPEQVCGLSIDTRSDIFAVGCVLHEMISGRPLFANKSMISVMSAILGDTPPRFAELGFDVPDAFEAIVARCLEKSREHRFQTARDLDDALETL